MNYDVLRATVFDSEKLRGLAGHLLRPFRSGSLVGQGRIYYPTGRLGFRRTKAYGRVSIHSIEFKRQIARDFG
jgi:hypothetical protein